MQRIRFSRYWGRRLSFKRPSAGKVRFMNTKELLEKYDEASEGTNERPLYLILKANAKHINGLIENDPSGAWFHKAHRTIDVTESGYMDTAIWLLLGQAEIFWKILHPKDRGTGI